MHTLFIALTSLFAVTATAASLLVAVNVGKLAAQLFALRAELSDSQENTLRQIRFWNSVHMKLLTTYMAGCAETGCEGLYPFLGARLEWKKEELPQVAALKSQAAELMFPRDMKLAREQYREKLAIDKEAARRIGVSNEK